MFKKLEEYVSSIPYIRLGGFLLSVIALIFLITIETSTTGMIFFLFSGLFLIVEGLHLSGVWSSWKVIIDLVLPDVLLQINVIKVKKTILFIIRLSVIVAGLYLLAFGLILIKFVF